MNSPKRRFRGAWKDKKIRWGVAAGLLVFIPIYVVVLRNWLIDITWGIWFFVDIVLWITAGLAAYWYLDQSVGWNAQRMHLVDELTQA